MPYTKSQYANSAQTQNNTGNNNTKNMQPARTTANGYSNMQPARGTTSGYSNMQGGMTQNGSPANAAQMMPYDMQMPSTVSSTYYTAGFLKQFMGRNMRVEFLIGTNGALVDRVGVLVEVGASYIVLRPYLTDDLLMCDLYSIKFVNIYGPGANFA